MTELKRPIRILLADDDPDDRLLTEMALEECPAEFELRTVEDGVELMEYLQGRGDCAEADCPKPDLILLDLNMPRMDGREAAQAIKEDKNLRTIPVVVLTTSQADQDVLRTYDLGVNSFVTKPVTFDGLVEVMKDIERYWFRTVALPGER